MIEAVVPVSLDLPLFAAIAFQELPKFLEAVQAKLMTVESLSFNTDRPHNPQKGEVVFKGYGNTSVTFFFRYRPGEEGTRGTLNQIERIAYQAGDHLFEFEYLEHYCGCRHCHGMKYPYHPNNVPRYSFENYSEDARLFVIRQYIGRVH